jgi:paraquat-inducible protein B
MTLSELRNTIAGFSQDAELYIGLDNTVNSLNAALENLTELTRRLSDKPNSVLFSSQPPNDPVPEAPKQ